MSSGLRFYTHAIADGIKPIVGCDLWITNSIAGKRNEPYRLTVYCQNHTGYLSLCLLLSKAWMENQYLGRGELKLEWLTPENCKGLICLSGGPLGIIERLLMGKTPEEADAVTEQLKKAFPGGFTWKCSERAAKATMRSLRRWQATRSRRSCRL